MRLGRYTVVREIGRGGAGTVVEARSDDGETVALKVHTGDDGAGFEREVRLHAGLDHPGVVRVLDHGREADGTSWVAMEHIDGGSLADRLAAQRLAFAGTFDLDDPGSSGEDEAQLLGIVLDLCPALAWLHGEGMVHADLKPANVLLRGGTEPVIADLGLSRAVSTRTRVEDRVRGSLGYVSPEQARGEPLDARADLFSLGAILFEVLTGSPPTDPANPREALRRLAEPPEPPSSRVQGVDPRLDALVLALLDRDRTRRPAGAVWVAHELSQVLGRSSATERRVRAALFVPPLVGREAELEQVTADTRDALRQGGLVAIRAAKGLGATRLAAELTTRIRAEGVAVAGARGRAGAAPLRTVRALAERVAEVARVDDPLRTWRDTPSPTADLAGLGHQLADQWRTAASRRPLLLVVDDLDQVGSESIEVLGHALGELLVHPARVALVATAHDRAETHVEALLASGATIMLRPLPAADLLEVAAGTLGVTRLPTSLEHVLPERTGGSPLLAREWVTTAVAEGAIRPTGEGWGPATDPGTPATLGGLIDARLDHLDAAQIEVIAAAGWLGDHLTEDRLAIVDEVGGLRAALAYHLMERDVDGPRLVHTEVAARAVARIPAERTAAIRRSLADRFGDQIPAIVCARWLDGAGDEGAAARSWARVATEESRHHPALAMQARVRVAELTNDPSAWWEAGEQAIQLGLGEVVARTARALAGLAGWEAPTALLRSAEARGSGDLEEAVRQARTGATAARDPRLRRQARHLELTASRRLDPSPAALRAAFADDLADPTIASTLAWHEERWEDAAAAFEQELQQALEEGDTAAAVRAAGNKAAAMHRARQPLEAHECTVQSLLLARRAGLRETECHVWMTLALGYEACGRDVLAQGAATASLALAVGMGARELALRAIDLCVECATDEIAWHAADLAHQWKPEHDDRLWVAARLRAPERASIVLAEPFDADRALLRKAWEASSIDEVLGQHDADPTKVAKALDTWFHRTGEGREAAIGGWRSLAFFPGVGMALTRLGVPPDHVLPDPPVSLAGAMLEDPSALLRLAARRFSPS
ncbi:MAG: protein kinase [Myxococcales bacterium]|nr:protein kinase [Myxococcales bacterium]